MRYCISCLLFFCLVPGLRAQIIVTGTVLDNSKKNYIEAAKVVSTGGVFSMTDSLGHYSITVHEHDSIYFVYNDKPTQKFPVAAINTPGQFDISLRIPVRSRYSVLQEVVVYSKTFKQDSIENRQTYADVFEYKKPGLSTSITPGGGVGADADELINIFRFKRNKRLKAFRQRLEDQEQDKYVDYRFNKLNVKRITGLDSLYLDSFMVWYRPTYEFAAMTSDVQMNQYILNAYYRFKTLVQIPEAKKEEL